MCQKAIPEEDHVSIFCSTFHVSTWKMLRFGILGPRSEDIFWSKTYSPVRPSWTKSRGEVALHWAAKRGHGGIVKILLEKKANQELNDPQKRT